MGVHNTGLVLGTLLMVLVLLCGPGTLLPAPPGRTGLAALGGQGDPVADPLPPGAVMMMTPASGCEPGTGGAGEVLVDLANAGGGTAAPLATLEDRDLAASALTVLRRAKGAGPTDLPAVMSEGVAGLNALRLVGLDLNDSSAPLHLVLQSLAGGTLWEVRPAPGVRIARITVVGAAPSGLLDPAPGIPIRFLLAGTGDCLPPLPWINADGRPLPAYVRWFEDFTRRAKGRVIAPRPALDAAIPVTGGRPVLLSRSDHVLAAAPAALPRAARDLRTDLLTRAAGGDLAAIWPAPVGADP